jgi:hypothetical protein
MTIERDLDSKYTVTQSRGDESWRHVTHHLEKVHETRFAKYRSVNSSSRT